MFLLVLCNGGEEKHDGIFNLCFCTFFLFYFRRDSFITHRAFCDALAQESARHPTPMSTITSHLYGSSNMGLGLSQVGPQISSIPDQSHHQAGGDMLRLGGSRAGQFDHLIPPAIGLSSSFRAPQSMASSGFYIPEQNHQEFHEDQQPQHGALLGNNKPFHGLVQLPELQNNTNNAASLFNLSFFSNSSNANTNNIANNSTNMSSAGLLISDQFNVVNVNGGSERNNLFSSNIMGDQISSGVPSLFSNSIQNDNSVSHMSATALLQKAAQMGSTSSNNSASSLLRGFAGSSSANTKSENRPLVPPNFGGVFGDNESHLQDLMNSLGGGSSSIFGGGGNAYSGHENENPYGGFNPNRPSLEQQQQQQQQQPPPQRHSPSFCNMDEMKLHQNLTGNMGGSDRLTRDFLGVGQMVRTISGGGFSQRDLPPPGINMGTLDSERNSSTQTSQAFGGGNFQ